MLVLTRKANESIVINGNIEVRVLKVKGSSVSIGIEAPKDIPVRRKELEIRIPPMQADAPVSTESQSVA